MQQDNRPLSPHLQVYRMTDFTSATSIMHRMTGVAFTLGLLLVTWWLAMTATGEQGWHSANTLFTNPFIVLVMFLWTGAFIYHLCNGIRHLLWDAGRNFEIEQARKGAKIVTITTVVINLCLWFILSLQ